MTGKFITVEGGEGAGKSSNLAFIKNLIEQQGIQVIITREPGGTVIGEKIRDLLIDPTMTELHPNTELLLMFAARTQHLEEKIVPQLNNGVWVICDRFTDATYAYQGGGRGLDIARIKILEQWVHGNLQPDMTLLLDLDVATGLSRAKQRGEADRFEKESIEFFDLVRNTYLSLAQQHATRFKIINASLPLDSVQKEIALAMQGLF